MGGVEVDFGALARGLLGGLALFLLGMEMITSSLTAAAGDGLRRVLGAVSRNRVLGALAGAAATAVLQSSSITTVLVVGFTSAGFLTLRGAIPLILGANVGSTVTAQVIAVDITEQALVLVAIGFAARMGARRSRRAEYGGALLGLGLVLLGLRVMSDGMAPLRTAQPFLDLMTANDQLLAGLAIGALFTALVQSSSATTGVVVVLAGQGLVSLPMGIAIVLGANVGTCVTAVLASLGKPTDARRAAAVHVVFNLVGVLAWVGFVDQLAALVERLSPSPGDLATAQQLANAHTLFNVVTSAVFLAGAGPLARFVERLVPDRSQPADPQLATPRHLDPALLGSPVVAMEMARREAARVVRRAHDMVALLLSEDPARRAEGAALDDEVDALHGAIVAYLGDLSVEPLSEDQHRELTGLLEAVNELEQIGDAVAVQLAGKDVPRRVSPTARDGLVALHAHALGWFDEAAAAVVARDPERAAAVIASKARMNDEIRGVAESLAAGLGRAREVGPADYAKAIELVGALRRLHQGARRMARTVSP